MLLPLDGFFSTFGESIHGLISFDHLKIGRARTLWVGLYAYRRGVFFGAFGRITLLVGPAVYYPPPELPDPHRWAGALIGTPALLTPLPTKIGRSADASEGRGP